jgi:hypothetical protein
MVATLARVLEEQPRKGVRRRHLVTSLVSVVARRDATIARGS